MLVWLIITCEIGFWVMLALGLFARFVLKLTTLSKFILLSVPLLDIALLVATTIDLHSGSTAEFAHGLAAVYVGFTLVYGHAIIQRADAYVSYKFYSGKNPKQTLYGWPYAKHEWRQWLKGLLACVVAVALQSIAIFYIDDSQRTAALASWYSTLFWIMAIWFVSWPLWYTIFPKKQKTST